MCMKLNLPERNKLKRATAIEDIIGKVLFLLKIEGETKESIIMQIGEKGSNTSLKVQTKWGIINFPQDLPEFLGLLKNEEWNLEKALTRKVKYISIYARKKAHKRERVPSVEKISLDKIGFNLLMNEIKKYVYSNGIITLSSYGYAQSWDVRREDDKLIFGTEPFHTPMFITRIMNLLFTNGLVSFILRSFTDKKDNETGLPIKELRGYIVKLENNIIKFDQITLEELITAHTTYENIRLAPEPAVIFCGKDGQISSNQIIQSIKRQIREIVEENVKINIITNEISISRTDIFRSITDLIYMLYEKYTWNYKEPNPEAFERKLSVELQKLSNNVVTSPTGRPLYNIEYPKWLPNKIKDMLFSENLLI